MERVHFQFATELITRLSLPNIISQAISSRHQCTPHSPTYRVFS